MVGGVHAGNVHLVLTGVMLGARGTARRHKTTEARLAEAKVAVQERHSHAASLTLHCHEVDVENRELRDKVRLRACAYMSAVHGVCVMRCWRVARMRTCARGTDSSS